MVTDAFHRIVSNQNIASSFSFSTDQYHLSGLKKRLQKEIGSRSSTEQDYLPGLYKKRLLTKNTMDCGRFLPDLKTWTPRDIACAAGLIALSAGAGYCFYRSVLRESAPPDHTQPPHEPEDVLEDSSDTPSVLQVVEPNLQLLPVDSDDESSAVVLDVEDVDVQLAEETLSEFLRRSSHQDSTEAEIFRAQAVEPNLLLLPTEPQDEPSAADLPFNAGELMSAWYNVQFLSADSYSSLSGSLDIKRYLLGMIRGPESRFCWFRTTESRYFNRLGFPYHSSTEDCFTGVQAVSGRVTEFISCNRVATSDNVPPEDYVQTFKKVTCTYVHVGADDRVDTATWVQEDTCDSPYSYSESQPDSEEGLTPEMEVPFISDHLADRGVTDIDLKLCALRQAFSTLLASIHNQNFLFVVGKKIVMRLAAANNQNVVGVQLAYEALIRFLRRPSNQDSIEAELSGTQLYHYNFVDVFFELLLFGYFKNGSAPQAFKGGFLERLISLICMWDVDVWTPAADMYFTALIDQLTVLTEVLFSRPVELYSDPAALASAVLCLLRKHVQLMERL